MNSQTNHDPEARGKENVWLENLNTATLTPWGQIQQGKIFRFSPFRILRTKNTKHDIFM